MAFDTLSYLNNWYNANPSASSTSTASGGSTGQVAPASQTTNGSNLFSFGTGANGAPDYSALAKQQYDLNKQNADQQMLMNNPNQYGPGGSQVRTKNPDGTYSLTTTLSPTLQHNYDAQNALQGNLISRASSMAGNAPLSYGGVSAVPNFDSSKAPALSQFDTSGVSAIPTADANDLAQMRDSVYQQQTQYLDPQFQQAQSDLESKLANQGIMPGSEAYNREMNNFGLTKQKAYGDARNSAIQAGGQEQSRLFGLGLQANQAGENNALNEFNTGLQTHTSGLNDALTQFNTGLQKRQQGVSEANTLHNSPYNDLASLRTGAQVQLPTFAGGAITSTPGVDLMNAANMGFNANLNLQNANAARSGQTTNGLFGLGSAAIQSGALNGLGGWLGNNLFGANGYGNFLSNNGALNLSPSDLLSVA